MQTTTSNRPKRILFLCTGNYYRSRFAEIFFNWQAKERGLAWTADSRGLALDGCNYGPISRYTLDWLRKKGVAHDADPRFPRPLSEVDLASADLVVAVKESEHRPLMVARFPAWSDRIDYWHVHDLDCATPDDTMPLLENELIKLLDRLAERSDSIAG